MFDALKRLLQPRSVEAPPAPLPPLPPNPAWEPIDKLDSVLEAAIRLFARALENAGKSAGKLALPGEPPEGVAARLADSVVFAADGGRKYLTLGLSQDFKTFLYAPHVELFLILNAATLLEGEAGPLAPKLALTQIPRPLLHAHMMRAWIKFIQPTGEALRTPADRQERLQPIMRGLKAELFAIARQPPGWFSPHVNANEAIDAWTQGFPAALGQYLGADTPRLSGLPMNQPAADAIQNLLAAAQAEAARRAVA